MQALLTIGIPAYNSVATIARCLDSIFAHAPEGVQVIISDDCSTDGTEGVCRDIAERTPNVEYVRQSVNLGPVPNFRFVFERARTRYFMWLADDDRLGDGFVARALEFLESHSDHVLATATTAYYDKSSGAFQFASLPSSIEDDDPCRRVELYLENLIDASELYGMYRREARRFDAPNVMGWDWIWLIDTAFAGKIRVIDGLVVHRRNRWDSADRFASAARDLRVPPAQAAQPHYTTALAALLHIALGESVFADLPEGERASLALRAFRLFRKNQQLPADFSFWPDGWRLFGDGFAARAAAFRSLLARQCVGALQERDAAGQADREALELALLLKLWTEPMGKEEEARFQSLRPLLESRPDMLAAYAYHALFFPAFKQPRFFTSAQIPHELLDEYVTYVTAPVDLFEADGDIEACFEHTRRVIGSLAPDTAQPATGFLRLSRHRARAVSACVQRLNMIQCYFSSANLKPLMEARAHLASLWLRINQVAVDGAVQGGAAAPRLRVGLLVGTLNSPTDTYMSLPAIAGLDRAKFEIVLLTLSLAHQGQQFTPMEQFAGGLAERSVHITGDLNQMTAAIRNENLDFLLIGGNVTAVTSQLFSLSLCRLAKWQIAFNPCCVTTGSPNLDYFVSGTLLEARGPGQEAYTERLVQIEGPGHVRIVPPFDAALAAAKRAAPRSDTQIRFVSGANYYKLTPGVRRTWLRLLASLPEAVLHLYPFGPAWTSSYDAGRLVRILQREARAAGVAMERIRLLQPFPSVADMHRFLGTMDVYLDSFPFTGINSVLDALSSGIPVVVLAGDSFRSNMGPSAVHEIGFPEWVAANEADYVAIARALVSDREGLARVKERVYEAMQKGTRLYDAGWFSREFGRIMEDIAAARLPR